MWQTPQPGDGKARQGKAKAKAKAGTPWGKGGGTTWCTFAFTRKLPLLTTYVRRGSFLVKANVHR